MASVGTIPTAQTGPFSSCANPPRSRDSGKDSSQMGRGVYKQIVNDSTK